MYKIIFKTNCMLFLLAFGFSSHAQEVRNEPAENTEGMKGSHRLTLGLGHTQVAKGIVDGKKKWLALPSWAIDYDYWLSNRWAIGIETDMVLESFTVEEEDGKEIERSYPISIVPVGIYKPFQHVGFVGGVGGEFSKESNFLLTRLGFELTYELPREWEVGGTILWDNKWKYYNSWNIAFTVSKIFKDKE